jgi:transcriptional regulator with XRE-family HTH domain
MDASSVGIEEMLEIGSSLREARRRQGLELDQVAAATMIRARYLEAIENERFELLPDGPYRRSFLREYAEYVGLDGDVYAAEYDLRIAEPEPAEPRPPSRDSFGVAKLLGELPLARAVVVVAAAAAAGVGIWQLAGSGGTGTVQPPTPPVATTHPRTQPRAQNHRPTAGAKAQAALPPVLALTASRGSCWLLVRIGSSAGRTVYEQTLQQGQTVRFGLRKPLWIRLGAPRNLDATIGRRQVTEALPSRTGDTLVTAAGLRPTS